MAKVNCAIYTRKSTEDGLDQDFNSLDNQFESAKAYIESQKHENWKYYKRYDDGGFTGANTKRPGLTQLLEDIEKGFVQVVVVYKVDRLSRSLIDFSKMMELFEARNVDFVSVTQHFNTSNSIGKLTLNVLLSFAQFEREVTGERIRDKIANSRKKGMWMGGTVPYGYKLENKKLYIEPKEAKEVIYIFESYLNTGSILKLKDKLKEEEIRTRNNKIWGRGALGRLLTNPTYIGKARHKNKIYNGQQERLIVDSLWQAAQEKLNSQMNREAENLHQGKYLLFKKLYTAKGELFKCDSSLKYSKKKKVRYEYYISENQRFRVEKIDQLVTEAIKGLLLIGQIITEAEIDELKKINWDKLKYEQRRSLIQYLISKAIVYDSHIKIEIEREKICFLQEWQSTNEAPLVDVGKKTDIYLSGNQKIINITINFEKIKFTTSFKNQTLLWNLAKGIEYRNLLESGIRIKDISKIESKQESYIVRILKLGYLAPNIICEIIDKQKDYLTIQRLEKISKKSCWETQVQVLNS